MSIPYLDLPFYKIFLQTPIHFCPLVSFSSTHIFLANNPESSIIINFIYYKFTTVLNNLKTQGTLNLNWTHWSLLLHSSLQSSQLETLQIISRNFILLTLSLTHSAIHKEEKHMIHQKHPAYSPLWIMVGGWDVGVKSWRPSEVVGERQITREGIRTENIREAILFIVAAEVARRKENSYFKVLKMWWI